MQAHTVHFGVVYLQKTFMPFLLNIAMWHFVVSVFLFLPNSNKLSSLPQLVMEYCLGSASDLLEGEWRTKKRDWVVEDKTFSWKDCFRTLNIQKTKNRRHLNWQAYSFCMLQWNALVRLLHCLESIYSVSHRGRRWLAGGEGGQHANMITQLYLNSSWVSGSEGMQEIALLSHLNATVTACNGRFFFPPYIY